jgi:hypothetical protein
MQLLLVGAGWMEFLCFWMLQCCCALFRRVLYLVFTEKACRTRLFYWKLNTGKLQQQGGFHKGKANRFWRQGSPTGIVFLLQAAFPFRGARNRNYGQNMDNAVPEDGVCDLSDVEAACWAFLNVLSGVYSVASECWIGIIRKRWEFWS